jgi:hypothetical protein
VKEDRCEFFGDADQAYLVKQNRTIRSFDLRTGAPLKEATFGDPAQKRDGGLSAIATGIANRGRLLAVEKDEMNPYLALVDRKTLDSHLLNFSREVQQQFFTQFKMNPSGSVAWTSSTGVFREGDKIRVTTFPKTPSDGVPDASGRFIVGSDGILDLQPSPAMMTKTSEIPGATESTACSLDVSGRYLLLTSRSSETKKTAISVREVAKSGEEIFKLILPANFDRSSIFVISDGQKMICPISGNSRLTGIYHVDIPALAATIAAGGEKP